MIGAELEDDDDGMTGIPSLFLSAHKQQALHSSIGTKMILSQVARINFFLSKEILRFIRSTFEILEQHMTWFKEHFTT
jgi:hypothetical protein